MRLPTWRDYRPGDPDVCVWCHVAGCSDGTADHLPVCPSITGLWPIRPHEIERRKCCPLCDYAFALGEYEAIVADPYDPQWSLSVCQPCALLRREEAERMIPEVKPQ